jgi:hypothetical protein
VDFPHRVLSLLHAQLATVPDTLHLCYQWSYLPSSASEKPISIWWPIFTPAFASLNFRFF